MIEIDNILINKQVLETEFTCDLKKCKGGCCTIDSEYGAPLDEIEISLMEKAYPIVKKYLPEKHIKEIEKNYFWEEKESALMTRSLDNKACLFVYYDGDIAKCAIEKAFFNGEIEFRKPISCHLFPIREDYFGGTILRFEKFSNCSSAIDNGKKTKIKVVDFCKDALIRAYGKDWFNKLNKARQK